jgi:hypothetical protein
MRRRDDRDLSHARLSAREFDKAEPQCTGLWLVKWLGKSVLYIKHIFEFSNDFLLGRQIKHFNFGCENPESYSLLHVLNLFYVTFALSAKTGYLAQGRNSTIKANPVHAGQARGIDLIPSVCGLLHLTQPSRYHITEKMLTTEKLTTMTTNYKAQQHSHGKPFILQWIK